MKCNYVKKDGKKCESYTLQNSQFCYFHSPEMTEKRIKASSEGGSKPKTEFEPAEPIRFESPESVITLLQDTVNRVRKVRKDGSMDTKTANCIAFLASKIIEATKVIEKQKSDEETISKQAELIDTSKFERLWYEDPIKSATQINEGNLQIIERCKRNVQSEQNEIKRNEYKEKLAELEENQITMEERLESLKTKEKIKMAFNKLESMV